MLTRRRLPRTAALAWLIVQSWVGLVAFDAARFAGFGHLHARLKRRRPARRLSGIRVADVVWALDEACVWYVKRAACLQRSAVAAWLLRRHGYDAALVIGYRTLPFESHAWVEIDGRVVNDRPQYQKVFRVLDRI
jgi:transglutaminase superfamily protein